MNRFPQNARVCFIGDSITCGNGYLSRIVDYYHKNFPGENINFYNCGLSGAATRDLLKAFDTDTATYRPTHAVIMVGVNDTERDKLSEGRSAELYSRMKTNFEQYQRNLDILCRRLLDMHVEITLCTSVPIDEYAAFDTKVLSGSFALMMGYAEYVRKYAAEKGFAFCDYFAYFTKMLCSGAALYSPDRIHPNDLGHYHMAKCFLASQGLEIGAYGPYPRYMERWRALVQDYRYMLVMECLWLEGNYSISPEEGVAALEKLLPTWGQDETFVKWLGWYRKNKPNQEALKAEVIRIMEEDFKNSDVIKE